MISLSGSLNLFQLDQNACSWFWITYPLTHTHISYDLNSTFLLTSSNPIVVVLLTSILSFLLCVDLVSSLNFFL